MSARAHLKLIVSEPASATLVEGTPDRISMVQPVDALRFRLHWLRAHAQAIALCSASALLLSAAGFVALGWW